MKSLISSGRVRWVLAAAAAMAVLAGPKAATRVGAEPTEPASAPVQTAAEPLKIVVTAVGGTAEVKLQTGGAWQAVAVGMELPVGCQIRTGIPGAVQLKVGDDQVCRIDRLSLVRVVRAEEDQGKIKTVMGMTYGRVSKDVDEPVAPHDDTIVSPTSTLAVRGTRVSLYDQPPYAPEAVSLTGKAVFTNSEGREVHLGKKGEGTVKVDDTCDNPASYELRQQNVNSFVDPGIFPIYGELARASDGNTSRGGNAPFVANQLQFLLSWSGLPLTVVDFSVMSPKAGDIVFTSSTPPIVTPTTTPLGTLMTGDGLGVYKALPPGTGTLAALTGNGNEEIDFGVIAGGKPPAGTYTITETLQGTKTDPIHLGDSAITTLTVTEVVPHGGNKVVVSTPVILNDATPTSPMVKYTVTLPLANPKLTSH